LFHFALPQNSNCQILAISQSLIKARATWKRGIRQKYIGDRFCLNRRICRISFVLFSFVTEVLK
jgi:hypothetical protein